MKTCSVCKIEYSLDNFHNCKSLPLGKAYACKGCARAKATLWNAQNKERKALVNKKHYEENKDAYIKRSKEENWNSNNKEKRRLSAKILWASNPGKGQATVAQRRAARNKATPCWADLEQIKCIYMLCAKVSEKTGVLHHVDHIIPLKGKNVCGLHVENNLRVIPAKMNLEKGNKYSFGY